MNRKIFCILISCIVLCSLYYVFHATNMSLTDFTSESTKDNSVFHDVSSEDRQNQGYTKTDFTWKDSKGEYLGEEVSEQINKELSNRKSNDVVAQDTISSFLGKPIVINDKIYEQISAIAAQDKMLSYNDSIIQIGNVRWCVSLMSNNIVLMTSVQPDDSKMKQVVKYLTGIYGKPYEDEEDGYDIKWSSSDNPSDIFRPGSTLVHLRRVHSDEGGTFLFFD